MYKNFDKSTITSYFLHLFLFALLIFKFCSSYDSEFTVKIPFIHNSFINNKWIIIVLFAALTIYIAFSINNIIAQLKLFSKNNNLTSYLFLFFSSFWLIGKSSFTDLIFLFETIFIIELLLNSILTSNTVENYFKTGLCISIVTILVPINLIFLVPTLISFNIVSKNTLKDIGAFVLGLILPIYILVSVEFLMNDMTYIVQIFKTFGNLKFQLISGYNIYCLFIILIGFILCLPRLTTLNINTRMLFSSIFTYMFVSILFMILFTFFDSKMISCIVVMTTMYSSVLINLMKNTKQRNLLLILTIILSIINIFVL